MDLGVKLARSTLLLLQEASRNFPSYVQEECLSSSLPCLEGALIIG